LKLVAEAKEKIKIISLIPQFRFKLIQ